MTLTAQASNLAGGLPSLQWRVDGTLVQSGGLTLTHHFPIGVHVVEATLSGGSSAPVTCTTTVTVLLQPQLSIRLSNEQVIIAWTGSGPLQGASQVTGPWSGVPGATNPYATHATGAHKFYRVRCP